MSDDLVKRLREYAIHMDAWGKEANHDADIVDEAADRIEKLEATVEQLRDDNSSLIDSFDKDFLSFEAHIEKLEAALHQWDNLIVQQFTGSRAAMSSMTEAAQITAALLHGEAPWPETRIEKLETALKKIAQHDMQAIAMDALRPGERIRKALDAE